MTNKSIKERLKVGMILRDKDQGGFRKVLATLGDIVFLSGYNEYNITGLIRTFEEVEKDYILPEEKWVPEHGSTFFYVSSELKVCTEKCEVPRINFPVFSGRLIAVGNCFPHTPEGKALAEKKASEIRELLAK